MVARRTVSIPEDLDKRMDRVKEPVNWSQVAARAFEAELAAIALAKEEKNMDDVVQRLRSSKLNSASEDERAGRDAGEVWAKRWAEWPELVRLAEVYENNDFQAIFSTQENSAAFFLQTADPVRAKEGSEGEFYEWLEQVFEHDPKPSEESVLGFWAGAVKVYREVAGKM